MPEKKCYCNFAMGDNFGNHEVASFNSLFFYITFVVFFVCVFFTYGGLLLKNKFIIVKGTVFQNWG